jgi:hypothetical protein
MSFLLLFVFAAVSAIDVLNIAIPSDHINAIDSHAFIYNEDIFGVGTPGYPGKSPSQFKRTLESGGFSFTLETGSEKYTRLERGPLKPSRQLEEFIQEQKKLQAIYRIFVSENVTDDYVTVWSNYTINVTFTDYHQEILGGGPQIAISMIATSTQPNPCNENETLLVVDLYNRLKYYDGYTCLDAETRFLGQFSAATVNTYFDAQVWAYFNLHHDISLYDAFKIVYPALEWDAVFTDLTAELANSIPLANYSTSQKIIMLEKARDYLTIIIHRIFHHNAEGCPASDLYRDWYRYASNIYAFDEIDFKMALIGNLTMESYFIIQEYNIPIFKSFYASQLKYAVEKFILSSPPEDCLSFYNCNPIDLDYTQSAALTFSRVFYRTICSKGEAVLDFMYSIKV